MNPLIQLKTTPSLLITLTLLCFGLSPTAQALLPAPAPDGGYPGGNTAEGTNALFNLTSGINNTAVGANALTHNTTGGYNVAIGARALASNTTGSFNMAVGTEALRDNTANYNSAIGFRVLFMNSTGNHLTGIGAGALSENTTGIYNTATGANALFSNTEGIQNTATGALALRFNTTGTFNTGHGYRALFSNQNGTSNTANGFEALATNLDGNDNTAVGYQALLNVDRGAGNTALGALAGTGVSTANNVICIGATGANVPDSCFIGNIYSNVQPIVGTDPDSVTVTSTGRLGRGGVSSRRYKHDIKPMDKASEVLYMLKPVSFRYHKEYDSTQTLAFGLIAEEVAEVYPDLVGRNHKGEPDSVRYEQINAMLLNEFLKEHRTVQEQGATIAELKKQIETLTAGLQKVSAQLEASKPAPQVVLNNQ